MEIVDTSAIKNGSEDADVEFAQMKQMTEPVSLAEVPGRIIQRRLENFQIMVSSITSMFGGDKEDTDAKITGHASDEYGFDKTLVFLTKPNKAIAISSLNGNLLWSTLIKDPVRRMVLEQADGNASIDMVTSKGNLVKIDPVTGAVRSTEQIPKLAQSIDDTEFIVAQGHLKGDPTAHRSTIVAVPKQAEGKIVNLKASEVDLDTSATGPSYYTQIKKAEGKIFGYRLNAVTMQSENTWKVALDSNQEIREVRTQYLSNSQVTKGISILPTVFGQDGDLFYKFLDSSMFSVVTANKNDPSTLTVYLINGVTGRIVHQFKEAGVSASSQHHVSTIFSEQFFIMSLVRVNPITGVSQNELTVIELYSKKKEGDT